MSWRKISYVVSTSEEYIWNELDYYSSPDNVNRYLKKKYPGLDKSSLFKTKSIEISSCIKQAKEYFRASREVGYATKPLLLFYGVENLTIALILILKQDLTMRNLRRSHGVELIKHKLKENELDLSKILLKIGNNGTFFELFNLTFSDWALPIHINPPEGANKQSAGYKQDIPRSEFTGCFIKLKDIISLIVEIYSDFIKVFEEHPGVFSGLSHYIWKGDTVERVELFIDKRTDDVKKEFILEKLPMFANGYDIQEGENHFKFFCTPDKEAPLLCENIYEETFIKRDLDVLKGKTFSIFGKKLSLIDFEVYFLIMFSLSILSRYEPKIWHKIMSEQKNGLDYLVKRIIEHTYYKYPLLVLREIYGFNIRQRSPGTTAKIYK